jgi:hypothetical protein
MCVPISILTKGQISGCQGLCTLWPQAGAVAALGAGLVWNMTRGETGRGDSGNKDQTSSQS